MTTLTLAQSALTMTTPIQDVTAHYQAASTLVVFDERVADLPLLYGALLPGTIAHTIASSEDAIVRITQLLAETGVRRLAIVAHGEPGVVHIGASPFDRNQLQARANLLQEWGIEEIALYACEAANGEQGTSFILDLSDATGATVAASATKVGSSDLGGTWDLVVGNTL